MRAARIRAHGGPEVLRAEEVPDPPAPREGEARVRVRACGVNFIDIYQRRGLYPIELPATLGLEGAGVVESVGSGVRGLRAGDRVAWADVPGSYAEVVVAPAARLVPIPEGVALADAAAAMLQGMTAHFLTRSCRPLREGDVCLVHAAAGGVGRLLVQYARAAGARPIGTVSTEEKASIAREAGCADTILYTERDFETEARRLTGGRGVDVVYDSVGRATFEKSLGALARRGTLVLFGQSSGPVPPFDPLVLARKGSLFLTRPMLFDYIATREELLERAQDVLARIAARTLRLRIEDALPLERAAEAHRRLESRTTAGKLLLVP